MRLSPTNSSRTNTLPTRTQITKHKTQSTRQDTQARTHRPGLVLEHEAVSVAGGVGDVRHDLQPHPPEVRREGVVVVVVGTVRAWWVSIGFLRYLQQPAKNVDGCFRSGNER